MYLITVHNALFSFFVVFSLFFPAIYDNYAYSNPHESKAIYKTSLQTLVCPHERGRVRGISSSIITPRVYVLVTVAGYLFLTKIASCNI